LFTDGRATRRQALLAGAALASQALVAGVTRAHGRIPLGGTLSMRVPWPVAAMDPHRLDDAASLLFGPCVFESLYAASRAGPVTSVLAHGVPEESAAGTRVILRQGLRFASGRPLTPRDVASALARSRSLGGRAWLDALGTVRVAGPDSLLFGARSASRVAEILASPLAAVVPDGFSPERPDGTGPFAADRRGDTLVLTRNRFAASGPAFLDSITIAAAPDLAASLRAFESGEDDVGWLGLGLHEPRRGAISFDAGAVGWAVLGTGDQGGRWNAPGVAQRLADGIDPSRLAHLGIREPRVVEPDEGWGGPPAALVVRADSPWLVELARAVAAALSRADHDVTVRPLPPADFAAARSSRAYALALDLARPFDPTPLGTRIGLAAAEDPARALDLARHPPLGGGAVDARVLGRLSRVGVLAEVHLQGGHMPDLTLPPRADGTGVDFGAIIHPRPGVL
jgi:peptide/nickel transport system substrate-binding protein